MTIQAVRVTILVAAGLTGLAGLLAGCSTSTGLGDAAPAAKPPAIAAASPDITGSIAAPTAAPAPAPAAEQFFAFAAGNAASERHFAFPLSGRQTVRVRRPEWPGEGSLTLVA